MRIFHIPLLARVVAVGFVVAVIPYDLEAQEADRRPSRAVFGSAPERPNSRNVADLNATFVEVYDDNILADQLPGRDPRVGDSGTYPMGTVDLRYIHRARRVTLSTSAGTGVQYFSQYDGRLDRNHYGSINVDLPVGSRTRVRVEQRAAFATYYTLMGLPGAGLTQPNVLPGQELLLPSGEFGVSTGGGLEYHTGAAVSRQIGRNDSLDGRYGIARTRFAGLDSTRHDMGFVYRHTVGRQATLHAGYGYQTGTGGLGGEPVAFHDLDLGIEYQRSLTRSQNTTVSFSTGSAIVRSETTRDYRLLADASLVHLMGRSWSTSLGYHRGLEYVSVLSQLVSSDAVTSTLSGLLASTVQASVSASYSRGHLGSRHGDPLTTYSAVSRLQYALSRTVAVDVQYLYYFYEFGAGTLRPIGVAPELARQSVRGGISLFLPLLR